MAFGENYLYTVQVLRETNHLDLLAEHIKWFIFGLVVDALGLEPCLALVVLTHQPKLLLLEFMWFIQLA